MKTEGWAAGLALAAISLREEARPEELIAQLDGSDTQVSDYLLDQVFNNQPGEIQEFLLKTATFNQFCAPLLCEAFGFEQSEGEIQALLETDRGRPALPDPAGYAALLLPLSTTCSARCCSHASDFHFHPDQIELFHRRAAAWLIRQGQIDEALEHLIAVRDWTGAAQLVEGQLCTLLNAEDYHAIKQRLGYFSEDFIATRPGLLLMQAWMAHFGLRLPVLVSLTTRIQVLLDAAQPQDGAAEGGPPLPGFEAIPPRIVQAHVWMLDSVRYVPDQPGQ